jgi:hypothetical protein
MVVAPQEANGVFDFNYITTSRLSSARLVWNRPLDILAVLLPHTYDTAAASQGTLGLDALTDEGGACLGITLAVSLALYGIVRAIGWVIGGFAAS